MNNTIWILISSFLVFFMQAGFAMLEAGFSQAKNAGNIIMKNLMDFSVGSLIYWVVGFAIMFGDHNQFIGQGFFLLKENFAHLDLAVPLLAFWLFQTFFAATAATIVSGAMAGRTKFSGYLVYSILMTGFIYPVVGYWIWGGGWLSNMVDFAGATVVHSVGGWASLAGAKVLGPRLGKYNKNGNSSLLAGHNLLIAALGVFILWFGWFGFNTGNLVTTTIIETDKMINLVDIAVVTNLSAVSGATAALIITWLKAGKANVKKTLNGALAGLVSITAGCAVVNHFGAVAIGALAGSLMIYSSQFIEKNLEIDDPVDAISVHGVCGALGTILVAFFAVDNGYFYGGGLELFFTQLKGVISVAFWTLISSYIIFKLIDQLIGLRVSKSKEKSGLDRAEHGTETYPGFTSLAYKNEFERFNSELAGYFINVKFAELDKAINKGLKKVAEFFGAEAAYIFIFTENNQIAEINYTYTLAEQKVKLAKKLSKDDLPWLLNKINLAENILIAEKDELPAIAEQERDFFTQAKIDSLIIVPIVKQNRVLGFCLLEGINDQRLWEYDISSLLKTINETFGDALKRKEIEEKIKESMDEQQLLLDNIKTQVWYVKDPETYLAVNEARAEFLGINKDEIAETKLDELVPDSASHECKKQNRRVFREKEIINTQGWVENAEGEERFHSITKIPKLNEQGEVEYIICSAEDITDLKKAKAKVNKYADKLDEKIDKAQKLHEKFLPSELPDIEGLSIADYYQPAEKLGGDFYNLINLDELLIGYMVDITGHGIDGSLLNIFVRETINSFLLSNSNLTEEGSLTELMKFITTKYQQEEFSDDYFISLILFTLDKDSMELTYSNAGFHIPPLLSNKGELLSYKPIKEPPISPVIDLEVYDFKERKLPLHKGDSFLITTDGIVEEKVNNQSYGLERLTEQFLDHYSAVPKEMKEEIIADFKDFSGQESGSDDLTLLILKRIK